VREDGRQKVCVSGLMENEVADLKALVRVSIPNTFLLHACTHSTLPVFCLVTLAFSRFLVSSVNGLIETSEQ